MDAEQTLVIILSVFLALFLLLGIVALSLFIRFMKKINRMADQIESTIDDLYAISESASRITAPLKVLASLLELFKKK